MGPCQMISVPPMCAQAVFWNMWLLPPQYTSFEASAPSPVECPKIDATFGDADEAAAMDFGLYESSGESEAHLNGDKENASEMASVMRLPVS